MYKYKYIYIYIHVYIYIYVYLIISIPFTILISSIIHNIIDVPICSGPGLDSNFFSLQHPLAQVLLMDPEQIQPGTQKVWALQK